MQLDYPVKTFPRCSVLAYVHGCWSLRFALSVLDNFIHILPYTGLHHKYHQFAHHIRRRFSASKNKHRIQQHASIFHSFAFR